MIETAPIRHAQTLRVYWEDTDAGGIVYYANYLKFFERARTDWLRSLGFSQQQLLRERGLFFVVAKTSVNYRRPARLDDLLELRVATAVVGRVALVVEQQALRVMEPPMPPPRGVRPPEGERGNSGAARRFLEAGDSEVLATGSIRLGCVDAGTLEPRRIPDDILELLDPLQ